MNYSLLAIIAGGDNSTSGVGAAVLSFIMLIVVTSAVIWTRRQRNKPEQFSKDKQDIEDQSKEVRN